MAQTLAKMRADRTKYTGARLDRKTEDEDEDEEPTLRGWLGLGRFFRCIPPLQRHIAAIMKHYLTEEKSAVSALETAAGDLVNHLKHAPKQTQ
jgi:hypothetical protein